MGLVPQEDQGSGFILDKQGHILTNYHVIADARNVEVTPHNQALSGHHHRPRPSHDLALLQINAPDLQPLSLATRPICRSASRSSPSAIPSASAAP